MDRKFNLIIHGIPECPKDTANRIGLTCTSDLHRGTSILSNVDDSVADDSISDCFRVGKYSESACYPRPILVRMSRTRDVLSVLSKRGTVTKPYVIKPDMSAADRKAEALLLKERWRLIQSGYSRSDIRLRTIPCIFAVLYLR